MCILTRSNFSPKKNFKLDPLPSGGSKMSNFQKNQRFDLWNLYLSLDFYETFVKCASWRDLMVHERIFNFCQNLNFWENLQISTFASMESLFDAGFPPNLRPMCILRWSNGSRRNFQFLPKTDFWQIFQMSKFGSKSTFASIESLFDAGFPPNLRPMCILRWSNGSQRNFQFLPKTDFLANFSNVEIWVKIDLCIYRILISCWISTKLASNVHPEVI